MTDCKRLAVLARFEVLTVMLMRLK